MACNITSLTTSAMALMATYGTGAGVPTGLSTPFTDFVRLRDPRFRAHGIGIAIFAPPVTRTV